MPDTNTTKSTGNPFTYFFKECELRFNFGAPKQQLKITKALSVIF